ncbi:MAG: tRNA uridine-5-carboxymethylaminomethyl(34) synthesis enzyme MnmG [Candidatus Faecalibacterium intestinavium]|uniref:tRNA uridine 5-carboxymethylaminomethyl modification enzyme MnmG n=1 Tax=Candidatus Faecalibacterium intestinavium TaxID=2838580 RepID=A0A9E2KKJ2_9FIRM|nr:tRNA uridine-5-carboxymethylaminomethyl(34) synthesis enzyme MnmG [Candidatus Faecalibacterium intestinavium]
MIHLGDYDVIVIGAGHAGIEAAHAAAVLGAKSAVFTMSLDSIGNMPCNPSIGGTAKGTLVREVDALGGLMGIAADATYLQSRMLNRGKGPAVHALRVQTDRKRYHMFMKHALEQTPGLAIHQAEITDLVVEEGRVTGVVTQLHGFYSARCVVIATGTNLGGKIFVGDAWYASGPDGMHASTALTESLKAAGLSLRRFKTGTPARVHRRSIDFSQLECQPGDPDSELQPFSFLTDAPMHNKVECWIAYTNPETHRIILDNIHRSPLYGGMIEGVGPRYCPSIEDKVVRFAGKDRHPLFVEPCGEDTEEMYLQGASSSLPEDVQNDFYHSIRGFEHLEIMRPAYAIEYDCVDPTSLEPTLESKTVRGLYGAGQFNGTSGYEEAAAQGLLAGLNAARNALGLSQLVLPRQSSYLGTLVDDLVTKGVMDPYRMMTSRSEYRLTLRQDNADQRLTPIGREYGLVGDDRWENYQRTQALLEAERRRLQESHIKTEPLREAMLAAGLAPAQQGGLAAELLRRPEISYPLLAGIIGWGEGITPLLAERLETEIKYAGYIARQDRMIHEVARQEKTLIPPEFEYQALTGLTLEAREKLARIRPRNLGQAGRIPGVSPSDVAQLSIALAAARANARKDPEKEDTPHD